MLELPGASLELIYEVRPRLLRQRPAQQRVGPDPAAGQVVMEVHACRRGSTEITEQVDQPHIRWVVGPANVLPGSRLLTQSRLGPDIVTRAGPPPVRGVELACMPWLRDP